MTKLIAFGDSIFAGWNGKSQDSNDQRIPELIGKAMGWEITNTAISGAKFDDSDKGFPSMAKTHSAAGYDYALVCYGVNDWCFPSGSIDYPLRKAKEGIETLKGQNPSIKILLELPTEDFRNGSTTLFDFNSQGWTQNQLDDGLIGVANQEGIDYYDWRPDPLITYDNASELLGDGNTGVHPTPATSQKIADRLVMKFKEMMSDNQPTTPPQPTNPTQPTTPIDPDKPVAPVAQIKIDRLDDMFHVGDNVDKGAKATLTKINEVYQKLSQVFGSDPQQAGQALVSPGNPLERPLRTYVLKTFQLLQEEVNQLVRLCNDQYLVDPDTGDKTPTLSLLRPTKLKLDSHYIDTVNYNYYLIEQTINKLIDYINQYV
ncbi:SGNH/GDSL hydrolase family protein [Limosilactobacillus sp.]|uniref:SGNH/GDSL hydrolase family protein n=1 Tax=Limosilactobacillus sp. TaxID=2773925 RepID=UPI003EFC0F1E